MSAPGLCERDCIAWPGDAAAAFAARSRILRIADGLPMSADIYLAPVDLAREAGFWLGDLEVRPSLRQVGAGDTAETLEPRVMQVLVALAQRRGEVVSRDELVARCWDGRIVSDDAINRCIARVRRLAQTGGGFEISTVARVGYRLKLAPPTRGVAGPMSSSAPALQGPLVVVLPFDSLSDDAEMSFFSDGVAEEIMQMLARRGHLRVIGRTSSFQFRGQDKAIDKVAAELGVSHVLDGSVRRAGERIRVSAHLVDARSQVTLWADQFDRRLADVFGVQEEIAQRVAEALDRKLSPAIVPSRVDLETYELYLRARDSMLNMATSRSTVAALDEVTRRVPDFAAGWALAAQARQWLREGTASDFSGMTDREALALYEEAQLALARASTLAAMDPDVVAADLALQPVCPDWGALERRLHEGLAAYPEDPRLLYENANLLNNVGRYRAACLVREELHRRDPLHAIFMNHYALALETVGRADDAMELYRRAARRWPTSPLAHFNLAHRSALRGEWETVDRLLAPERLAAFPIEAPMAKAVMATIATLRLPAAERRQAMSARLQAVFRQRSRLPFSLIRMAGEMADLDELYELVAQSSFEHLRSAAARVEPADVGGVFILFAWPGERFRGDVRFVQLCYRLGLVDYWISTGLWPDCADEVAAHYDFRNECERAHSAAN